MYSGYLINTFINKRFVWYSNLYSPFLWKIQFALVFPFAD